MKNKLFFSIIIFITLFLTISAISASEIIRDEDIGISDDNALSINSESEIEDNSLSIASQNEGDSPIIRDTQSEEDNNQSEILKSETELSTNTSLNQTKTSANSTTKTGIRTYLQVIDKKITYHVGSVKEIYQVRLLDVNKKPISGKKTYNKSMRQRLHCKNKY